MVRSRKPQSRMAKPRRRQPEADLQRAVMAYLRQIEALGYCMALHVPNGARRHPITGAILRGLGMRAGAPDIIVLLKGGKTLLMELKAAKGRLSDAQESFGDGAVMLGHRYVVVRDLVEAQRIIQEIVGKR